MKLGRSKPPVDNLPGRRKQSVEPQSRATSSDLANRYAFRRNRTLTGSSSANVASTNELNAELKSPRAHVHHLTSLRRQLMFYFSCVMFATFGLYLLVSQLVATTTVNVAGATNGAMSSSDATGYQNAINSYYAARPVERLRFLLNEEAFVRHVQAARPETRDMRVEQGSGLGEASIVVVARQPIARWDIGGSNQYVDGDGVVFSRNYFDDPALQIVDNSGLQTDSNRLVASNRFLGFVGRVIAKSQAQSLAISKVTIPTLTTRQVSVSVTGQATEYKLSVDRSAGEQVEDMARITRYLAAQNLKPGYVDVRISGKAYYK